MSAARPERDYRRTDWDESMPGDDALAGALARSRIEPLALDGRIARLAEEIGEDWPNGRAMAAQFYLDLDPALVFFLTRNRLHDIRFFAEFFRHAVVREALPALGEVSWSEEAAAANSYLERMGPRLGFELIDGWRSLGRLASRLSHGGVYRGGGFKDPHVIELVEGLAEAAFGGRRSEALSYHSWMTWSDWFDGDFEDGSYFWLDRRTGLATVLLITDGR
ncbi:MULTISPECIES: hypothetical protein [unclassified Brevundimonas]|uniref:hypothetical protein n=1 Tax=unclassified Brevundimonas TaxID=2622653 RepID=UPI0006FB9A1C|nr:MULTISPECIES: hypothetical protein [unclassified Brevundimonas]KQY65117.1 hypothetical protein ASD25_28675 [Brevundimonas sp. Root1423]KRA22963.1 hypothetical protein ASD59_10140 [Brevundimonas sp. Root608]